MVKEEINRNNYPNSEISERGDTRPVLKFYFWKKGEDLSMEPQWPEGPDFVCHQWMNATLHCTPSRKVWDNILWEGK